MACLLEDIEFSITTKKRMAIILPFKLSQIYYMDKQVVGKENKKAPREELSLIPPS